MALTLEMTQTQAARTCGVSRSFILQLIALQHLPAFDLDTPLRWTVTPSLLESLARVKTQMDAKRAAKEVK